MTTSEAERSAMQRALALAVTPGVPLGPNPRVGCVLLAPDGTTVAEGFHRGAGTHHAEVDALRAAGDAARGSTAVVTLEPCNHTGRTGPCSEALVAAGVRRVVFAQADTNPVAEGGAGRLREAGIEVEGGLLADEARAVNRTWTFARRARPTVRHVEVRDHPRRPQRGRRRHQPLGLQPRRAPRHPPAARAVRHDARRHAHGRGRRPRADRPRRGRRAGRAPAAARGHGAARPRAGPPDPRRPRRDGAPAHPRPARGARDAVRARPPARLPRGRPDARPRLPRRRAGRRGRRLRRPDAARRRQQRGRRPRHHHHRRRPPPPRLRRHGAAGPRRRGHQRATHHDPDHTPRSS